MTENLKYSGSLKSIIKIEPEEFQTTDQNGFQSAGGASKSKADCATSNSTSSKGKQSALKSLAKQCPEVKGDQIGHSCDACQKVYAGADGLRRHKREVHSRTKDPQCRFCEKVFKRSCYLKRHLESVHLRMKKMFCDLCAKVFFTKHAIYLHMQHHRNKTFFCDVCDFKTAIKENLKYHKLTHGPKVKCPICKKQVSSMKNHHVHAPKESCRICQRMVPIFRMKIHMKIHAIQKCDICKGTFKDREDLRRHKLKKHYKGRIFECHCGKVVKSKQQLKRHHHSHSSKKITCKVCHEFLFAEFSLKAHCTNIQHVSLGSKMRILRRNNSFICDKCGSVLLNRPSFLSHAYKCYSKATKCCSLCWQFFHRRRLESRIKVEPDEFQQANTCLSSDDVLRSKAKIFSDPIVMLDYFSVGSFPSEEHRRTSIRTLVKMGNEGTFYKEPHICCLCQKAFARGHGLKTHIENVHCTSTNFKAVECPKCKKKVSNLKNHINKSHQQKTGCPICNVLCFKRHLKAHMKTHRIRKCAKCHQAFKNDEELRRHTLRKHYTGKLFECNCGSVHKTKKMLKQHKRSHTNENLACDFCQKRFSHEKQLQRHCQRMHSSQACEKIIDLDRNSTYTCDKCGSELPSRSTFLFHIYEHHSSSAVFCDLCMRPFRSKTSLAGHMNKFHLKFRPFE